MSPPRHDRADVIPPKGYRDRIGIVLFFSTMPWERPRTRRAQFFSARRN